MVILLSFLWLDNSYLTKKTIEFFDVDCFFPRMQQLLYLRQALQHMFRRRLIDQINTLPYQVTGHFDFPLPSIDAGKISEIEVLLSRKSRRIKQCLL